MKIKDLSLFDFLQLNPHLWVPLYQRNFNWKNEQFLELSKDLKNIINSSKKEQHYLGTMVFLEMNDALKENSNVSLEIIDGQQRLTTIFIMLIALRVISKNRHDNESVELIEDLIFLDKKEEQLKVQLHKNDDNDLSWLLEGSSAFVKIYNVEIKNCYSFYYREFGKWIKEEGWTISDILEGVNNLKLVFLHAKQEENAQLIYDRINTAGLRLSTFDKLKNIIYLKCTLEEQQRVDSHFHEIEVFLAAGSNSHKVDSFLFNFYVCLEASPPSGDMFKKFEEIVNKLNSIDEILSWVIKMKLYAYIYGRHIKGGAMETFQNHKYTDIFISTDIKTILLHFRTFRFQPLYATVMFQLYNYYTGVETLAEVTEDLYKLLISGLTIVINKGDKSVFFNLAKFHIVHNREYIREKMREDDSINYVRLLSKDLDGFKAYTDPEKLRSILQLDNTKKNRLVLSFFSEEFREMGLTDAATPYFDFTKFRDKIYEVCKAMDINNLPKPLGMIIEPINDDVDASRKRPYYAIINGVELEPNTWKELKVMAIKTIIEQQKQVYNELLLRKELKVHSSKQGFVSLDRHQYDDYVEGQAGAISYYINNKGQSANAVLTILKKICEYNNSKIECI